MVRLTQTVQKGGCAAKVPAAELRKILAQLRFPAKPKELLVDGSYFDDAAIYRVTDDTALVQTLDFFTPIVDTPSIFGKVATANAISDVYAMGGIPKTAMAILAFPLQTMESEVIVEVLQGASDLLAEAGVAFVGGHSIDDDTLKFGMSVTGYVHPEKIWSNTGAREGDVLILTKALGTGTMAAALKRSLVDESGIQEALDSMMQLNNAIQFLGNSASAVHAATDITGFGLAGHGMQMARASGKILNFNFEQIPVFRQAWEFLDQDILTKAHRSNDSYTKEHLWADEDIAPKKKLILFDPQTSGGLLLSVAKEQASSVLEKIRTGFSKAAIVGEVKAAPPGEFAIRFN